MGASNLESNLYPVARAAALVGAETGWVSYLLHMGMVVPERVPAGSGDRALLNEKNIRQLRLVRRLEGLGVKRALIKQMLATLESSKLDWMGQGGWLVGLENNQWFVTNNLFDSHNKVVLAEAGAAFIVQV